MKLIKINNSLFFIVNHAKIKQGDWCLGLDMEDVDRFFVVMEIDGDTLVDSYGYRHPKRKCLKITHSTGCFKGTERIVLSDVLKLIDHDYDEVFSEGDILRAIRDARCTEGGGLYSYTDDMIVENIKRRKSRMEWDVEFLEGGVLDLKINYDLSNKF